tara:strand:+ start:20 stop:1045 length:1026 start_codon:yes stop_codon:yes gene_type:complete
MLRPYSNCIWNVRSCGKKNSKTIQNEEKNFYLDYLKRELQIPSKEFNSIKTFNCTKCKCVFNSPWLDKEYSRKFYSIIYGQHNKGWLRFKSFINQDNIYNHGDLFNKVILKLKIKKYAEYNCPFTGIFNEFFLRETKISPKKLKELNKKIQKYFINKQLAGFSFKQQQKKNNENKNLFKLINRIKKNKKNKTKKYLITDQSKLVWGENCNYKSINCKSYAEHFYNLERLSINDFNNQNKSKFFFDLFGIFFTLDHTFEPNKIFKFALRYSKYVLVHSHINPNLGKQHYFSLTKEFPKFLQTQGIDCYDLTNKIKPDIRLKEIYFVCSKNKNGKKLLSKIYA